MYLHNALTIEYTHIYIYIYIEGDFIISTRIFKADPSLVQVEIIKPFSIYGI